MASVRSHRMPHPSSRQAWTTFVVLAVVLGLVSHGQVATSAEKLAPSYWKQRLFYVPYQLKKQDSSLERIAKVQLMLSRDGVNGWYPLQEAKTSVQGFSYHAPADGEYWFALRHIDRKGQSWPNTAVRPLLRIIVDTAKPTLKLSGSLGVAGAIVVRYEARDANLRSDSLVIETRVASGNWTPLPLKTPDVAQPDRLVGHAEWSTPFGAETIGIRASIADRAGHQARATTEVSVAGPSLPMPSRSPQLASQQLGSASGPVLNSAKADPFQSVAKLPPRDWPASNQSSDLARAEAKLPRESITDRQENRSAWAPPLRNSYTATSEASVSGQTKAKLIANDFDTAPDLLGRATPNSPRDATSPSSDTNGWSSPSTRALGQTTDRRTVNSRTFDVEYDLQSVGPWGIAKVELWGTHDNGRTWQSYGADPDNRSPVRATVDGAGVYGFRILVDGANGLRATPPRSGDQPELVVAVDLQPPAVEILSAQLGQGNLAGHLQLTWSVADSNLEPRPIGLFYSAYPNGPWSTVAAGLENTGAYTWRLGRHVPDQFFVRLEARDVAGNVATHQLPTPVTLARPQPTGKLRSVRPVTLPRGL